MSQIQVDTILDKAGTGAPTLTYGVEFPVGYGITGAGGINVSGACTASGGFVGALTGDVTGTASTATYTGNAGYSTSAGISSGLTGTPNVTVNNVTAGFGTYSGNISAVDATFTGTVTYEDVTNVESTGIVTAGKGLRATTGGLVVTAGVSTLGVTTASGFTAKGTLIEGMSSTTTAYSSSSDLNITNGNFQFSSANLGGTNNTLNIMSTTGINTDLATNQVMNVTAVTACNASTAYVNRVSIDGLLTGITTHWVGGSAPTDGGGSGLDTYSFNVMKTGSATYIVIANQVKTS